MNIVAFGTGMRWGTGIPTLKKAQKNRANLKIRHYERQSQRRTSKERV
jgi:hypothetical protein